MNTTWKSNNIELEEAQPKLKKPSLYRVIMLNDDYTPMEFVVEVLKKFFGMNVTQATQLMLTIHKTGSGMCGVFTREVAETKVATVIDYARQNQHPLMCTMRLANA